MFFCHTAQQPFISVCEPHVLLRLFIEHRMFVAKTHMMMGREGIKSIAKPEPARPLHLCKWGAQWVFSSCCKNVVMMVWLVLANWVFQTSVPDKACELNLSNDAIKRPLQGFLDLRVTLAVVTNFWQCLCFLTQLKCEGASQGACCTVLWIGSSIVWKQVVGNCVLTKHRSWLTDRDMCCSRWDNTWSLWSCPFFAIGWQNILPFWHAS